MSQNEEVAIDDKNELNSTQKKEKQAKERKVISKYYAGTNVRKLPKIPKAAVNDLLNLKGLTMTPEQQEAYLTSVILGFIPDKFGLDAGLDTKLKAMAMLKEVQKAKNATDIQEDEDNDNDYLTSLREALKQRKIEGVDKK